MLYLCILGLQNEAFKTSFLHGGFQLFNHVKKYSKRENTSCTCITKLEVEPTRGSCSMVKLSPKVDLGG